MCGYARSRDAHRFSPAEFRDLLPQARAVGVRTVRFTGGEPLMHRDILELVGDGAAAGMRMSIITNGTLLPTMAEPLATAGLAQAIVSIDGAAAASHDSIRNTPGLFDRAVAGMERARDAGVLIRVNTVVGPHNYSEMPALQKLLGALGVTQWELSALKLERRIVYPDLDHVRAVCEPIYAADPTAALVPTGKRFYGDTPAEQELFFEQGITPRASLPRCHLIGDVIYLDSKTGSGYGCSLLPHRSAAESLGGAQLKRGGRWTLDTPAFRRHIRHFRMVGPTTCSSCSTTAAGYSDVAARAGALPEWSF